MSQRYGLLLACVFFPSALGPASAVAQPYLVEDVAPGATSSISADPDERWTAVVGDTLIYAASEPGTGREPWRSDGTALGTYLLRDIADGSASSAPGGVGLEHGRAPLQGGAALFHATSGTHGVWKTEGTEVSTTLVSTQPGGFGYGIAFQGSVLFAGGGAGKVDVWKTDGSGGGTTFVHRFFLVQQLLDFGGGIVLLSASDGTGLKLYRSSGSPSSQVLLSLTALNAELHSAQHALINGVALFMGNGVLWKTDATVEGTSLLANVIVALRASAGGAFVKAGSAVYFSGSAVGGLSLWKTDGTSEGTAMVRQVSPSQLVAIGSTVYFVAQPLFDHELWKSDGTADGTLRVRGGFRSITDLTVVDGALYFSGDDEMAGAEPWTSDGTTEGTRMLADLAPSGDSSPSMFTGAGGRLYFAADDGTHGRELWAYVPEVTSDAGVDDAGAGDAGEGGVRLDASADAGFDDAGTGDASALGSADAARALDEAGSGPRDAAADGDAEPEPSAPESELDAGAGARPRSGGGGCSTAPVETPASALTLLVGVLGLVWRRRRARA